MISLTTMMSASNKAGHWQYALQLFDELVSDHRTAEQLRQLELEPDVVLFNAAITACASGAAWERAWAIFSGVQPTRPQSLKSKPLNPRPCNPKDLSCTPSANAQGCTQQRVRCREGRETRCACS